VFYVQILINEGVDIRTYASLVKKKIITMMENPNSKTFTFRQLLYKIIAISINKILARFENKLDIISSENNN